MRVVHVIASIAPRYGGPSRAVLGLARSMQDLGHDVRVVTTDRDGTGRTPPEAYLPAGSPPVEWSRVHTPRIWGTSAGLVPLLRREIVGADIVHVHSLYLCHTLAATRLADWYRIPYVLRPHGTLTTYHRRRHRDRKEIYHRLVEDRTIARAAFLHCTSEQELEELRGAGFNGPAEVVGLGLNVPWVPPPPPRGRTALLYVGRLAEKKRPWLVVETVAELVQRGMGVRLTIAGPDDDLSAMDLRGLAARLGVEEQVTILGPVEPGAVTRLLTESTMLVLPSREENFGLAVGEALALGRPAVVTPGVALADLIVAARAGVLAGPHAASLADAVQTVMKDPGMGRRAHDLAQRRFAWPVVAKEMESAYRRVLNTPDRPYPRRGG